MPRADVVVIGAGLSGLSCAAELAESGARVFLAAKGMASTHWTHGGLDVAAPAGASTPRTGIRELASREGHPYATLHAHAEDAVERHLARVANAGLPMVGSIDAVLCPVPTALGALRRAAILPAAQAAALDPWEGDGLLLLGIRGYRDAWGAYAARNLMASGWSDGPREIRAVDVDLPGLDGVRNLNARTLAMRFEDPGWRSRALRVLADAVPVGAWRIGMPAVLGIADHATVVQEAEARLGHRIIEISSLPPSVPGMRLYDALRAVILGAGGRLQVGFDVVDVERDGRVVRAIHTEARVAHAPPGRG